MTDRSVSQNPSRRVGREAWDREGVGTLPTASKLCRFSRGPRAGTKVAMSVGAGGLSGSLWALTLGTGRRQG